MIVSLSLGELTRVFSPESFGVMTGTEPLIRGIGSLRGKMSGSVRKVLVECILDGFKGRFGTVPLMRGIGSLK